MDIHGGQNYCNDPATQTAFTTILPHPTQKFEGEELESGMYSGVLGNTPVKVSSDKAQTVFTTVIPHPTKRVEGEQLETGTNTNELGNSPVAASSDKRTTNAEYKKITETLGTEGYFGEQSISRYESVHENINMARDTLENLKLEKIELQKQNGDTAKIDNQIDFFTKLLENSKKEDRSYHDPNHFRNLCKSNGSYQKACDAYTSGPVNMRYQKLTTPNGKNEGFVRLGAITDPTDGYTNLWELNALKDTKGEERFNIPERKINTIKKLQNKGNLNENQRASLAKSLEMWKNIQKNQSPNNLDFYIAERRQVLTVQFAHLLKEMVERNPDQIGQTFNMVHICLLNEAKKSLDKTGWYHNEESQMMDMYEIYKEFDGKKVTFGDKFYIDSNGGIHLPRPANKPELNETKLSTTFININMRSKGKDPKQQQILTKQIGKLESLIENQDDRKALQKLINRLQAGESHNKIAEELGIILMKAKIPLSLGCMSAKDRTKIVAERIIRKRAIRLRKVELLGPEKLNNKKGYQVLALKVNFWVEQRKLLDAVFTDPNVASSVVLIDNTGSWIHKVSPAEIHGRHNPFAVTENVAKTIIKGVGGH